MSSFSVPFMSQNPSSLASKFRASILALQVRGVRDNLPGVSGPLHIIANLVFWHGFLSQDPRHMCRCNLVFSAMFKPGSHVRTH